MHRVLSALLVIAIALSPLTASAQERAPTPLEAADVMSHQQFVRDKLLTIGTGAIIGSLVGSYLVVFRGSMVAGALAGGLVASWWYGSPETLVVTDRDRGATELH